ncbi:MAG: Npt1/Npt2 family nucleotide transporter [Candidatus Rhabdochlamydia sp.]
MLWKELKDTILSYSLTQKLFILCAMVCGFCIMADYGIVRPISHSVFLSTYGSDIFPYVWIAVVPFNFLIIELYNRFLPKLGIYRMFYTILGSILVVNGFAAFFMTQIAGFPFLFYIWKEVYVMLLFQQLWSMIHSTIKMQEAKYLYGLFFAFGGLGATCGNRFIDQFAVKLGSQNLLFASLPLMLILGLSFYYVLKYSSLEKKPAEETKVNNFLEGCKLIAHSKYLGFILSIVVLMQVITTLIYYQFNLSLEQSILNLDARTEHCGYVFGIANSMSLILQIIGSFLLVQFLGIRKSHLSMPLLLCLNMAGSIVFPSFNMVTAAFIVIKALDFSIFGVLKEMLYLPLKQEEKFQAKAIIDVFAYRSAKAVASCLILFIQMLGFSNNITTLSWVAFILLLVWIVIVARMFPSEKGAVLQTNIPVEK